MDTQDTAASALSSASIPLPPLQQRGAHAPLPSSDDFKRLLATQGIEAPENGAPNDVQAKIMAAQIAGKANVNAGVKRQPVLAGMNTTPTRINAPARFMPLRQGPGAARVFSPSVSGSANTVEALRATTKFAPGPVRTNVQTAPVEARAIKSAQDSQVQAETPRAIKAYKFGLIAAAQSQTAGAKAADVPQWFEGAMNDALDKYKAMKAAQ